VNNKNNIFGVILLSCFSTVALGATATLTWTHPTQNTDGSIIPATGNGSIAQTRVEWGTCSSTGGFGTKESEVVVQYPTSTVTINNFVGGETVCFRAFSKNTYGVESNASAVIAKTFDAPKPRPPVLSTVITVAYEVTLDRKLDLRLARQVGTVEIGSPCMDTPMQTNKGVYYPIDFQYVTFSRTPKSSIVVTKCELV